MKIINIEGNICPFCKMSDINDLNKKIFELACALHGLEYGDTRALSSYEMIKAWLKDNAEEVLKEL